MGKGMYAARKLESDRKSFLWKDLNYSRRVLKLNVKADP